MKENSADDPANKPVGQPPENLSAENVSAADAEAIKPLEDTQNMEVHHHTHPTHGKKTWKNYFWEFLMLFLAVFCGFLAEWKLEHVIENHREEEFMGSMLMDLETDHANLAKMKSKFAFIALQVDSLIPLLKHQEQMDANAHKIYQHQVNLNLYSKWAYADRTIDQLKNSGNFRLIRKKAVSNGIGAYDGFIRNYVDEMQNSLILRQWQMVNDAGNDIFRANVFRTYIKNGDFSYHAVTLTDTPYFLTSDKVALDKFINRMDQYAVSLEWFEINIDQALRENKSLDSLIRKEYDFE